MSPSDRTGSVGSSRSTPCFVFVPSDLVVRYRPIVAAVYAGLARLCAAAKGAVDVSRTDLARWCGANREDAIGGAIERAIWDLHKDGWIMQEEGVCRKRRLLVAWGRGRDGKPRPWRFDRRDRARPERMLCIRVPLTLFDSYFGRLCLSNEQVTVNRYFDRPLLNLGDIAIYIARQAGSTQTTPRLLHLGLVQQEQTCDPAPLGELLAQTAEGTLTTLAEDATPQVVALSQSGATQLRRFVHAQSSIQNTSNGSLNGPERAIGGSLNGPERAVGGSLRGSVVSELNSALESAETTVIHNPISAWDLHGMNQLINSNPSPESCLSAQKKQAAANTTHQEYENREFQSTINTDPINKSSSQKAKNTLANSENNHIADLDPRVVKLHQALNVDVSVPEAEWLGLRELQATYGVEALLRWQTRAASARRINIRLGYYRVCAINDAVATTPPRRSSAPPTRAVFQQEVPDVEPSLDAPPLPRRRASAYVARPLGPEQAMLIHEIEQILGRSVRHPELLADVPLPLLKRWRAVADHPGLARWDDPLAWMISQMSVLNAPPLLKELNRWAERIGVHWSDPRLATERVEAVEAPAEVQYDEPLVSDFEAYHRARTIAPEISYRTIGILTLAIQRGATDDEALAELESEVGYVTH